MDTGVLARVLDDVLEYGGDYKIARLDLGRQHHDESYARIEIGCADPVVLQRILMRLQIHGVNLADPGEALLRPAEKEGVFPADFYSTTNLETLVKLEGSWVGVDQPEMDCGLVVRGGRGAGAAARAGRCRGRAELRVHVLGGLQRTPTGAAGAADRREGARGEGRRQAGALGGRPGHRAHRGGAGDGGPGARRVRGRAVRRQRAGH